MFSLPKTPIFHQTFFKDVFNLVTRYKMKYFIILKRKVCNQTQYDEKIMKGNLFSIPQNS